MMRLEITAEWSVFMDRLMCLQHKIERNKKMTRGYRMIKLKIKRKGKVYFREIRTTSNTNIAT